MMSHTKGKSGMTVDKVVKSVNNESMKEEVISRLKVNESDGNVGVVTN